MTTTPAGPPPEAAPDGPTPDRAADAAATGPAPLLDIGQGDGTVSWRALMGEAAGALVDAGIISAEVEARRIVEEASGWDGPALHLHLDDPATVGGVAALDRMVARRREGEPLQYVLGRWGFRSLDLMVDTRVLIPRPETEGLVDHVLEAVDRVAAEAEAAGTVAPAPVVVDLGCGTGAIALAVAAERRDAVVHAVDASEGAVEVTRANLAGLGVGGSGVTVHHGSWFEPLPEELVGRVTVVASNPPYVPADDPLPPEVADWEPTEALVPGPTGLEAVEGIVAGAGRWLVPGGALVVEIGEAQGERARALAEGSGFTTVEVRPDLLGRDRALVARWPGRPEADTRDD
ncbi:MAG TPA: peptide chain release factor N(5)-glutamine methyltransferase [Acidimicrobiales bacterium]|nr:peptide chain release factor N(5)-glutamine methyltransferase [Acidimicrobiales bacterium]